MPKPKIVITIEIDPPKDGGRAIIASGAPQGEIPEIRSGSFANLHQLVNEVWAALQRREEMKPDPTLTAAKEDKKKKGEGDKAEENEDADGESVVSEETTISDPSAEAAPVATAEKQTMEEN